MSATPIEQLESQLQKLVDGADTLTLAPDAISSAPIEALFAKYLQGKPLVVNGAQVGIPQGLNFVQVFGTGGESSEPFGLMSIDARFTYVSDAYQLTLFATFAADKAWWLARSFKKLDDPDDPIGFLPISSPAYSLSSSGEFSAPMGLAFSGDLQFTTQQTGYLSAIFPEDVRIQGPVNSVKDTGEPDLMFQGGGPVFSFANIFSAQPVVTLARQNEEAEKELLNGLYAGANFAYGATSLPVYMLPPFDQQFLTIGSMPGQSTPLSFSNITQLAGNGNYSPMLPTAITLPGDLTLYDWQMQLSVDFSGKVSLYSLSVAVGTGPSFIWPITEKIKFTSLRFTFSIQPTGSLGFGVEGMFLLDEDTNTTLQVYAAYPGFAFGGALSTPGIELKKLVALFSDTAADAVSEGLQLTALSFRIDPGSLIYHFDTAVAATDKPWQIKIGDTPAFSLLNASLVVDSVASAISFACQAQLQLGAGGEGLPLFTLGATYTTADGWTFLGKVEQFTFPQLVSAATGYFPEPLVKALEAATPNIAINLMSIEITPSGKQAGFQFVCDATWTLNLGGSSPLVLDALVDLTRIPGAADSHPALMAGAGTVTGTISGTVRYEDTFELTVVLTLLPGEAQNYAIELIWGALRAKYDSATKTVKFTFGAITLGEMVEKMVNAVVPGQNFNLTPPWDLLNSISLAGISVTLDFAKKTLSLSKDVGFSLAFVSIEQITLVADFSGPKSKVMFTVSKGSVLGIPVSKEPVGWNVLDPSAAKQVPGFGTGVLQVDFLALGQHFEPVKALDTSSLKAALKDVKAAFASKPTDPDPGLRYNAATNWIIGLECSLLDGSVWLGILFLDPLLYGVSIAVASKGKLGALGGLSFDILYKKINDTLGVYQARLTLPDAIRTLNFGSVSVTLPVFSLWIYTNGNFKVNFGFPNGMDFTESAALQILPFLGFGGFYFAVLDSSTATNLPKTIKGTFSPVISFGIGLQVGVGRTVSFGVISGGAYITLVAIIEGTFATWNPFPNYPQTNATYWAITGQASLVGRVYGVANFVVVVARFDLTITLSVQLRMAAYAATAFTFTASVSVSASISINLGLFSITIGFSFKMTYSDQFTIGSTTQGPWDGASAALGWTRPRVGYSLSDTTCEGMALKWAPVKAEQGVRLWLLPNVTAGSVVDGSTVKPARGQVVVTLVIERSVAQIEPIEAPSPFSVLAEGVLLWVLNAGLNGVEKTRDELLGQTVTYDEAKKIFCTLTSAAPAAAFTLKELTDLLTGYFRIVIEQRATGAGDEPAVSAFPVAPALTLQVMEQTPIPFSETGMTDADTLKKIRDQFYEMQPESSGLPQSAGNAQASLSTFLFLDYFMVIAKGTVQAAMDALKNAKKAFSSTDTLGDWAKHASVEEFAALNHTVCLAEGKRVALPASRRRVTGDDIAATAPVTVTAAAGETLLGLARRYGTTVEELALQNADVPGLFAGQSVRKSLDDGMTIGDLLEAMRQNQDFNNLAGQAARVLLQGLRLPWPAVGQPSLPLYAITGQQFDAAALKAKDSFTLSVADGAGFAFSGDAGNTLSTRFELDDAMVAVIGQMNNAVLDIPFTSAIQPFYDTVARRFTLSAPSEWNSSASSGALARASAGETLSSWQFPPDLVAILAAKPELLPLVELGEETRDAAFLMPYPTKGAVDAVEHAWATIFQVTIAPVPSTVDPSQTLLGVYNLSGTDAVGGALLETLLVSNSTAAVPIAQLYILRGEPSGNGAGGGLVFDPVDATSFFVLQTNLSTASNPPGSVAAQLAAPAQGTIGMTPMEMLALIWECSVVRSGGYQLYYNHKDVGLPSALFAQNGSAQLTIAVTYGYSDDRLRPFMNSVVVSQPVDSKSELFIEAITDPQSIAPAGRTLRDLARVARMTVAELAERNADFVMNAGTALKRPLKAGQLGSSEALVVLEQPESLAATAQQLDCSVHALARANRDRVLAFAAPLSIDPILLTRSNAFPAGNIGFTALRNFAPNPMWLRSSGASHTQAMADAQVAQQFQLLTYKIPADTGFEASPEGVPLSAEENAEQKDSYRGVVPVARFAQDKGPLDPPVGAPPSLDDPYRGVGQTVELSLGWNDIYGNLIPHTAGGAYSLSTEILYADNLIAVSQWPGVGLQYRIEASPAQVIPAEAVLYVDVSTDAKRYTGDSGATVAKAAAARFAAIYYQLARNATVVLSASLDPKAQPKDVTAPLVAFVVASYIYTSAIAAGKTPGAVPACVLDAPVKDSSDEALFSLTASLTIARTPSLVEPSMDDPLVGSAGVAASNVAAAFLNAAEDQPTSLTIFAENLQACFPTLMVAVGTPDSTAGQEEVWLMRFGAGGYSCRFDPEKVQYVSLKPLALNPFSAPGIPIQTYSVGTPLPNNNIVAKTFSNIDLDLVAGNFLAAMDEFLSPEFGVNAWRIAANGEKPPSPNPVTSILNAKKELARRISTRLGAPFRDAAVDDEMRTAARNKLEQELLVRLSAAYQIDSVVALEAMVGGPKSDAAPQFYGSVTATKSTKVAAEQESPYTFSTALIGFDQTAQSRILTFTFATANKAAASVVDLGAQFDISHLMYDPLAMPKPLDRYTASSWLSFVTPFAAASDEVRAAVETSLGDLGIPVPLKAYPTPPSLVDQSAASYPVQDGTVERTRLWEYSFAYAYSGASQDDVHVKVDIGSSAINGLALVEYPFETALLQFTQSWEALSADLDSFVRTPDFTGKGLAAIESFAWLATQLSATWPQEQTAKSDALGSVQSVEFSVLQNPVDTEKQPRVLEIQVSEPASAAIPAIEIDGYILEQQAPGIYRYKQPGSDFYLPYDMALGIAQRLVVLIGPKPSPDAAFDILAENSAWGSLYVARNERYGDQPGNPEFIYRTPYVRHVTPAVPLLHPDVEIPMEQYTTGAAPLLTYLSNFTAALLTPSGGGAPLSRTLQIGCLYRYFVDEARQLPVQVPVALTVPETILPSNPVLQGLAAAIQGFLAANSLAPVEGDGSQFVFTFSLFDDGLSTTLPLLKLDRVTLAAWLAAPTKEKNP